MAEIHRAFVRIKITKIQSMRIKICVFFFGQVNFSINRTFCSQARLFSHQTGTVGLSNATMLV